MKLSFIIFLCLFCVMSSSISNGQAMVLPGPAATVQGEGSCSNTTLTVSSERWRVKKGEVFQVSAFHPFSQNDGYEYHWEVTNGKIVNGQGTAEISVKAGGQKTAGYINASGFVTARVVATRRMGLKTCSLSSDETIMIGKFREYNGYPNIDKISTNKSELFMPCEITSSNDRDALMVDVSVVASDPEADVLTYAYQISAGSIVGTGAKVKWDLNGVAPGNYVLFAGVDDGKGVRETKSVEVRIRGCNKIATN